MKPRDRLRKNFEMPLSITIALWKMLRKYLEIFRKEKASMLPRYASP